MTDATPAYSGPERILSGMQPTGGLHLGNYLGALKNWVPMQDSGKECFFCAVDMHAMTVEYDPAALPDRVRGVAAAYIAAGVDPKRSAIFAQSAVPEHAELSWVLQCVARMGWMERMTPVQGQGRVRQGRRTRQRRPVHLSRADGGGHPGL
jgi:tryptophanyl-tRNA synthetase